MTQAVNLANFANNLDSSGGVAPSALNAAVPVSKGGTNATTASAARTNLDVPSTTGSGASGTWSITAADANKFGGQLPSYYQTALGFTPIQQGGGSGQGANKLYIGWDNISSLCLQVDTTSFGNTWPINISGTAGSSIGSGQSWQNVASSRALNTNYTNNTGKPIQVTCSVKAIDGGNSANVVVDGVTILQSYTQSCCGVPQISYFPLSFIVPAGSTYRVNGSYDFSVWAELR